MIESVLSCSMVQTVLILTVCVAFFVGTYVVCDRLIRGNKELFLEANLFGYDYGKTSKEKVPEALGLVSAAVFLMALFAFLLLFIFAKQLVEMRQVQALFGAEYLLEIFAGLLSIACMTILGFADDVLNLRWRHKLIFPLFATLPLVLIYHMNSHSTTILLPFPVSLLFRVKMLDLGVVFYAVISLLSIFTTNSINILAGINGLEAGQSVIISISLILYALVELAFGGDDRAYLIIFVQVPFLSVSLALFNHNKYPARVFVGDTYCYFAGMTFAVTGVLGGCMKILLLFFIPQLFNFVISLPQLFKVIPCPRHRLPKYDERTDLRRPSTVEFVVDKIGLTGCMIVGVMARFGYARVAVKPREINYTVEADNLTVLNVALRRYGEMTEKQLLHKLLAFQVYANSFAFLAIYPLKAVIFK